MAGEPNSTIVFDGDSTGAVAALHAVDVEAKRLADSLKGVAGKMKDGTEVPDTAPSVKKLNTLTEQIKRLSVEAAYGKDSVEAFNRKIGAAGGDKDAFKPLLDAYGQVKAAREQANAGFIKSGQLTYELKEGTKAYSAALRQVPAQFTDIIVSLQGGQAPLTVLLQQGGQLKDVFGGVGNAFKALSSYVLGLINPFTIAAAAAGTLALAYIKGAAESEAFNRALIMTGNYAGTTSLQMSQMAKAISGATGSTIGAAAEALTALASSGDVSAAQFTRLGTAVTQWAKATGMSVGDVAKQFSKLQDEPLKATLALNDSQHYLTRTIYDQIKALEDQGRMLEAGALAQNAWSDAINQRAPLLVENLGVIEKTWRAIGSAAKWAWDGMLGIGRQVDESEILRKSIAAEEAFLRSKFGKVPDDDAGLNAMRAKLAIQEKGAGYEAQSAAYQREEAKATEAKVAWAKESDKYLSKQVQMQREIAKAQSLYSQQKPEDQNPAKYAETIAGIQKKYAEAPKHIKAASDAYAALYATLMKNNEASLIDLETGKKITAGENERLESLKQIEAQLRKGEIGIVQSEVYKSIADETAANHALAKARKDAQKAQIDAIKFMQAENKDYEKHATILRASEKAIEDYADSAKLMADDLVFETKLIGLNTAERERATEQRKIQLELDKEIRRINDTAGLTFEEKESQKAIAMQAAVSKASTASARSSLSEWMKTADSIRDSLVDAFDSAILTGKDLFTSLRDAAVKLFDGLVLRPILQGVLQPVATALTGSLIGTAANAATGQAATGGLIGGMLPPSSMGSLDIAGFTLPQIGMGIAALGILKSLGAFGSNFISATDSGRARVDYTAAGIGGAAYSTTGDATQIAAQAKSVETLAQSYFKTAASLGITAMQAAFEVGTNTGREGAAPQTVLGVNIGKVGYSSGEIASTDAAGLQLAASRAVLTALQASELPSYLSGVFDDITASTATQEQITTALAYAGSLKAIREALLETREPLQIVRDNVATAFDTLGTSAETFKADFVAAIDAGINQDNLAKWQTLGTALDTLAADAAATAKTVQDAADATKKLSIATAQSLTQRYTAAMTLGQAKSALPTGIADNLLALDPAGIRATITGYIKSLDSSTESGRAAIAQIDGLSAALDVLVSSVDTAAAAATDAAAALAATNRSWQDQLDVLTGAQTDRSIALRDAGDDSTRAIMLQVYAQQDLKTASELAAQALDRAAQSAAQSAAAIAAERAGLTRQLLTEQGDTKALRALELENIDPSNRALQEEIWALTDANKAAAAAAASAASASEDLKSAWQSLTDSIFDEVQRIRGLVSADSGMGYATAQTQFAITTAQARAGSEDAAKLLPGLSQTLLTLAEANATTLVELQRIRAQTAGSLQTTGTMLAGKYGLALPQFAVGTNYVTQDGPAYLHQGEAVIPKAYNPAAGGQNTEALVAEIRALRQEVQGLRAEAQATAQNTYRTQKLLDRAMPDGDALATRVAA